jgi:hypothetical protein
MNEILNQLARAGLFSNARIGSMVATASRNENASARGEVTHALSRSPALAREFPKSQPIPVSEQRAGECV